MLSPILNRPSRGTKANADEFARAAFPRERSKVRSPVRPPFLKDFRALPRFSHCGVPHNHQWALTSGIIEWLKNRSRLPAQRVPTRARLIRTP
jgi:hypothetical protein